MLFFYFSLVGNCPEILRWKPGSVFRICEWTEVQDWK